MNASKEVAVKGESISEPKADLSEDSESNLNKTGISKDTDNTNNLNINSHQKSYESKISLPINLNVDPQNYMLRSSRDTTEENNIGRTRSYSFSDGAVRSDGNQASIQKRSSRYQSSTSNPIDLDSYFANRFDIDNAALPPEPAANDEPKSLKPSLLGCARTISYHAYLCTCKKSCCCLCDTLFPPDCNACLKGVCVHLSAPHMCMQTFNVFPTVTTIQDKVT